MEAEGELSPENLTTAAGKLHLVIGQASNSTMGKARRITRPRPKAEKLSVPLIMTQVRLQVLKAASTKVAVFWVVALQL
jgi:hypothetical protein